MMLGNFKNWKRQSPKDICKILFEITWAELSSTCAGEKLQVSAEK